MDVKKIDGYNTSFKTKMVPNIHLERAFDIAILENNGRFLSAVEAIMNDGKNDILELSAEYTDKNKTAYKRMLLKINDVIKKKVEYSKGIIDNTPVVSGYDAIDLIIKYSGVSSRGKKSNFNTAKRLENIMEKIMS